MIDVMLRLNLEYPKLYGSTTIDPYIYLLVSKIYTWIYRVSEFRVRNVHLNNKESVKIWGVQIKKMTEKGKT